MEIIRAAPTLGAKLLSSVQGIPEPFCTFAKEIARSHMERYDGRGYPDGLKENQIPLSAQIVGLAEAYDVLRNPERRAHYDRFGTADPSGMGYVGENLAWGQTTSTSVITDPAYGWAETKAKYAGQGHRRKMLNSNFTKVGIACYVKDGKTCWAMCLGR